MTMQVDPILSNLETAALDLIRLPTGSEPERELLFKASQEIAMVVDELIQFYHRATCKSG